MDHNVNNFTSIFLLCTDTDEKVTVEKMSGYNYKSIYDQNFGEIYLMNDESSIFIKNIFVYKTQIFASSSHKFCFPSIFIY